MSENGITLTAEQLAALNEMTAKKKENELIEKGKRGELGIPKEHFEVLLNEGDLLGVAKSMGGLTSENASTVASVAFTNYESKKAKAEAERAKAELETLKKQPPASQPKLDNAAPPAGSGSQNQSSTIYPTFESMRQNIDKLDKLDPTYKLLIKSSF